jgi:hypothetical protein
MRCVIFLFFVPLFSFGQGTAVMERPSELSCRDSIEKLVNQAITIIKRDYYRKEEIDWDDILPSINDRLQKMESCDEARSIISWCFSKLNEKHSFLMPAIKAAEYTGSPSAVSLAESKPEKPSLAKLIGNMRATIEADNTGYILVPWISTTDPELCTLAADSLQALIQNLDKAGVSKWVIDLRANTGGNCWPMLAGLGPLLGEGVCGYFVFPDGKRPWVYRNGAAMNNASVIAKTTNEGYRLQTPVKKIAVLIGPKTSSSGEIVALAFKGKDNVSFFGEPSAGFTTANTTYKLFDRSLLVLSVCKEADRHGNICEGKIMPDEPVSIAPAFRGDDPVKNTALMWLAIF